MKTEIKVKELSKEEINTLFEVATYGNDSLGLTWEGKYDKLGNSPADILLKGGEVILIDYESEDTKKKPDILGKNHTKISFKEIECWNPKEQGKWFHLCYHINLQNLLDGMSNEKCIKMLPGIVDGTGDVWDAYNCLQIAVFGEEIYG